MTQVLTSCDGYSVGDRVELHPSTDAWMRGDRYGEIVKLTHISRRIHVVMDKSGRTLKVSASQLKGAV
jgi:hypothetical protein